MLFTVYDKKGEPFEVRPDHAKRLVINEGWSMEPVQEPASPPVIDEAPVPTETPKP